MGDSKEKPADLLDSAIGELKARGSPVDPEIAAGQLGAWLQHPPATLAELLRCSHRIALVELRQGRLNGSDPRELPREAQVGIGRLQIYEHLDGISVLGADGMYYVIVEVAESSAARVLFTVAHEIGHILDREIGRAQGRLYSQSGLYEARFDASSLKGEQARLSYEAHLYNRNEVWCNRFAASLLMPRRILVRALARGGLAGARRAFPTVSLNALVRRTVECSEEKFFAATWAIDRVQGSLTSGMLHVREAFSHCATLSGDLLVVVEYMAKSGLLAYRSPVSLGFASAQPCEVRSAIWNATLKRLPQSVWLEPGNVSRVRFVAVPADITHRSVGVAGFVYEESARVPPWLAGIAT